MQNCRGYGIDQLLSALLCNYNNSSLCHFMCNVMYRSSYDPLHPSICELPNITGCIPALKLGQRNGIIYHFNGTKILIKSYPFYLFN